MTNHFIDVKFVGPKVRAEPNPLPEQGGSPPVVVSPRDTVTWRFDQLGERVLEVVFLKSFDLDPVLGTPIGGTSQPTSSAGPFDSLSPSARQITGAVSLSVPQDIRQAKRFFYKIREKDVEFEWDNPVQGGDLINGGGIDIPRTPP